MDRDLFLLAAGAGISLITSVITLILNFYLTQATEKRREAREAVRKKQEEIHLALTSKDIPTIVGTKRSLVRLEKFTRRVFIKRLLEKNKPLKEAQRIHVREILAKQVITDTDFGDVIKDDPLRDALRRSLPPIELPNQMPSIQGPRMSKLMEEIKKDLGKGQIEKP